MAENTNEELLTVAEDGSIEVDISEEEEKEEEEYKNPY